ncbi:ATP-binding protein [Kitasatospora sp. LaBMicrA B282]|uniref:ATP-binding protein n=1 Tax=Kitasatospora sp. LaBMicrA B282 TaxID=3420949 RepID=UPI003D14CF51
MPTVRFTTAATSSAVHAIRGQLAKALASAGVPLSDEEGFTLGLLISEVATNALLHGVGGEDPAQRLTVEAESWPGTGRLWAAVTDPGRGLPHPADAGTGPPATVGPADGEAEHGRGLFLLAALAAAYGFEPPRAGSGQRVWFELALEQAEPLEPRAEVTVAAGPAVVGAAAVSAGAGAVGSGGLGTAGATAVRVGGASRARARLGSALPPASAAPHACAPRGRRLQRP